MKKKMKKILFTLLLVWVNLHLTMAQTTCVNVPHVRTLQVIANGNHIFPHQKLIRIPKDYRTQIICLNS